VSGRPSVSPADLNTERRRARDDEVCSCGRPAAVVFLTEGFGEVAWCGNTMEQIRAAARRHPANRRGEFIA